jgi:hypothetical protein
VAEKFYELSCSSGKPLIVCDGDGDRSESCKVSRVNVTQRDGFRVLSDAAILHRGEISPIHFTLPTQRFRIVSHLQLHTVVAAQGDIFGVRRDEGQLWDLVGTGGIQVQAVSTSIRYLDDSCTLSRVDATIVSHHREITSSSTTKNG